MKCLALRTIVARRFGQLLCLLSCVIAACENGRADAPIHLSKGDVVAFFGGTNMVRLQRAGYLETMLSRHFVEQVKFRDLSWEADTVYQQGSVIERWRVDGFGEFDGQLERVGATVAVVQFGQMESLDGKAGLEEFAAGYDQLIDRLSERVRTVVLLTPTPFEQPPHDSAPDLTERNDDLKLYVDEIRRIAKRRKLGLVDLFSNADPGQTDNGMHIAEQSQLRVAIRIAAAMGIDSRWTPDLQSLHAAVKEKHRLWYDYWRPANWKLLYGDDSKRQFTRGGKDYIPFREEWRRLEPMIAQAEQRVWKIAIGDADPGPERPDPEVLHGAEEADVISELESFSVAEGLHVNLFASELNGLTSPLHLRWDPAGRMYVTVTTTYPHVFPGDIPNDKVILLEDNNKDGVADRSTVFAEGLNIPTAIEWGDGGIYLGQNSELLFLKDTDDDGVADVRQVVLGGFGNGDSHQTINSFVWSPDGELHMGQGDGIESRVETPWGIRQVFRSGFARYRPLSQQLLPYMDDARVAGNPWGVAFDPWGQIFSVDGAGGVNLISPGLTSTPRGPRLGRIGKPGGYCGIGYLDGAHLPESFRGDFVIGDYKTNRVSRFSVRDDGAGFSLEWKEPLLQSSHRNFRPVDVKLGPDGAVYVVDWYNPITCHQDDAYRDPTRDKAHGRIWRISSDDKTLLPPNLALIDTAELPQALLFPDHWLRSQAKREMTSRDPSEVAQSLDAWVTKVDPRLDHHEQFLMECLAAFATIEVVRPQLLRRVLGASDPRIRAFATRIVGRWHDRLHSPLTLLADRIRDEHPRVRMEAIVACAAIPKPESIVLAASVTDRDTDKWIDFAFQETVTHLRPVWLPSLQKGELDFDRPSHLAAVLNRAGGPEVLSELKQLLSSDELDPEARLSTLGAVLAAGNLQDIQRFGLSRDNHQVSGVYDLDVHAAALGQLLRVARDRELSPSEEMVAELISLCQSERDLVRTPAIGLAGVWKVGVLEGVFRSIASNSSEPTEVRQAAIAAIGEIRADDSSIFLSQIGAEDQPVEIRVAAIRSLANVDVEVASELAAAVMSSGDTEIVAVERLLPAFLASTAGVDAIASALAEQQLDAKRARELLGVLFKNGRSDKAIFDVLRDAIGAVDTIPTYDESFVNRLAKDADEHGITAEGKKLFHRLACQSCHRIGGIGGDVGPDLTSIGTTLATERIIEEVLWPNRQVKEGFASVKVVTSDGRVHTGYQRFSRDSKESGDLVLEDPATKERVTIASEEIEAKKAAPSPMPDGLTGFLSRDELQHLVRYLSMLGKVEGARPSFPPGVEQFP